MDKNVTLLMSSYGNLLYVALLKSSSSASIGDITREFKRSCKNVQSLFETKGPWDVVEGDQHFPACH